MHPGHRDCCPQVSPLLQVLKEDGDGLPSTLPTTVAPRMPSVSIAPFPGPFQSHRAQGHPPPPPCPWVCTDLDARLRELSCPMGCGIMAHILAAPAPHALPPAVPVAPSGGPERASLRGHERHPRRRPAVLPAVTRGPALRHFPCVPVSSQPGPGLHRQEDGQDPPHRQPEGRQPYP